MDFFDHQAKANRASKYLILGYITALAIICIGFNAVGMIVWAVATQPISDLSSHSSPIETLFHLWLESKYSWQVTLAVFFLIGSVSLSCWLTMRQGGSKVAEYMGGRRIPHNTLNKDEKRLINTVEEMAIASGVPMPDLFLMDREHSINAFAAGYSPNEAAICVTKGLITALNRDELQGVIGHEFSHILNGDMRINVRLISILSGLLATGQLGRWLIEIGLRGSNDSKGGVIFLLLPGVLIWMVGSLGVLCSRMIKAAISRQREFLADASAVQFTRQTQGIASALYKISTHRYGSRLSSRHAEDLSHMCISPTIKSSFSGWLNTHPPISERITRIDRTFLTKAKIQAAQLRKDTHSPTSATHEASFVSEVEMQRELDEASSTLEGSPLQESEMIQFDSPFQQEMIKNAIESIGLNDANSIQAAHNYLNNLPESIITGIRQPDYVSAIVLLLLAQINSQPVKANQWVLSLYPLSEHYQASVQSMENQPVYPLLQLALNTLKPLTQLQRTKLLQHAKQLITSDKQLHPKELFIYFVLYRHLHPKANRSKKTKFTSLVPLRSDLKILFSFLTSFTSSERQRAAYNFSTTQFGLDKDSVLSPNDIKQNQLATAIFRIEHLTPMLKKNVLIAVSDLINHDQKVTYEEIDWLRMLADCWDCPIPIPRPESQ
jgi:Zn-dependent protease with chaperone function